MVVLYRMKRFATSQSLTDEGYVPDPNDHLSLKPKGGYIRVLGSQHIVLRCLFLMFLGILALGGPSGWQRSVKRE